ncbi:Seipin family [Parasponia andersonii]|uniref:Seipin family n=1 Tax=Parasponia andersonii TaxID=3476 RepID=A0A2P5BDT9_PARAD|nr:Seipin family [Parasponia andersonii]
MDLSTSNDNDNDQSFFDALDDFPFYDCSDSFSDQSDYASSSSVVSTPDPIPLETSFLPAPTIRQRPSAPRGISDKESKDSGLNSSTISKIDSISGKRRSFGDKSYNIGRNLKENGENPESTEEPVSLVQVTGGVSDQSSEYSTVSEFPVHDSFDSTAEIDDSSFNLLLFVAGLVIKAIGFQLNLFVKFVTFPIWVFSNSYMFLIDPFFTMRRGREYFNGKMVKFWHFVCGFISPSVFDWLKENKSIWMVALRCFWGLLWASYVCFILCCILFWSILFGGLIMRYVVEEPIQMKEVLNFDFTKHRPVAFVPVISCVNANCDMDCEEQIEARRRIGFRTIPPGHKLQATISLTLPESEYNRNLGIFQVRVDFLSVKGETLSSSSHPCMLQFKSEPIRLLWTFLKIAPLVTGYVSESQTLNVKFKGFTEGDVPTGCLKVTLEQRAEYRPGAGIPELYDASLVLESELPFFKRLLWYWKRTIFVWITMILFVAMLSLALLCCNRIIIPRPRSRGRDGATQNTPPESSGNGRWYRVLPLGAVEHRQLHFLFAFFSPSFL